MTAVYALRRLIKLSFACTSWRKSRESLKESLNRKEKIMTADEIQRRRRALLRFKKFVC